MFKHLFKAFYICAVLYTSSVYAEDVPKTEVIGVLYYADWCGSCKVLDPKIEQAKKGLAATHAPILFVQLDLTNEQTRYQSELLVNSLSLESSYAKYGGKTGFMLLLDADSKQVIARLTKNLDTADISKTINQALIQAKG